MNSLPRRSVKVKTAPFGPNFELLQPYAGFLFLPAPTPNFSFGMLNDLAHRSAADEVWKHAQEEDPVLYSDPQPGADESWRTLRIIPSPDDPVTADTATLFLNTIRRAEPPWLAFSLIASRAQVYTAFSAPASFLTTLQRHLLDFYPNAAIEEHDTSADFAAAPHFSWSAYRTSSGPLEDIKPFSTPDPFLSLISYFEQLRPDETVAITTAFRPQTSARARYYGAAHIHSAHYSNAAAHRKRLDHPFWDVDVFILTNTPSPRHASTTAEVERNFFRPLGGFQQFDYLKERAEEGYDLWYRNLFNSLELTSLIHFPHKDLENPIIMRNTKRRKPAPDFMTGSEGLLLGENEYHGTVKQVRLPHARRGQHIYVVGASGSGKSAHMCNLMKQDIDEGAGFALLDPHGDLAERVLTLIPEERAADVVYFNPTDREHITPLNVFAGAKNPQELVLIADGVIVTFRRLVESWGDRMENILRQTVYTLLAVGNKTFADIQRMLSDPPFREQVVAQLTNPPLKRFWQYDFPNLPKNACDPITNKFSKFLNPLDPTRFIFSVPETKLDFSDIMQGRKIFLANLAQGQLGEDFSQLLGALLVSQFQLSATRRAAIPEEARTPFTLYVDEFQNFTSGDPKSFEKILSEARKYKLQLVLAHQFTSQLPTGVTDAILGNVYTQIVFRVGLKDAALLQHSFTALTPDDLQNLDIGNALTRCGKSEDSFSLKTRNYPSPPATNPSTRIQAHSRDTYSIPVQQAYDHEDAQYKQAAAAADTPADEEILGRT